MKKSKKLKKLILLSTMLTPTLVSAETYLVCGTEKQIPEIIGKIFSTLLTFIKILTPIIFVIMTIITLISATMAKDSDDNIKKAIPKIIKNLLVIIMIFSIIPIINFVARLAAGKNNTFSSCLNCLIHPDNCKKVDELGNVFCPGTLENQDKYDENCNLIEPLGNTNYGSGDPGVPDTPNPGGNGGGLTGVYVDNNTNQAGQLTEGESNGFKYYLYIPKKVDYSKALIVFLHGSGEVGNNLSKLDSDRGFSYQIKKGMEFNCYVLLPQTKSGWDNTTQLKNLIDKIVQENGIDNKRINLVGFSMGANYLPTVAKNIPHYFASVSAISISKKYSYIITEPFEDVATYFFTGGSPTIIADGHSNLGKPFYDALTAKGYKTNHKYYPGQGHPGFVEKVLTDENFNDDNNTNKNYKKWEDWVLDQRRS